jgi:hypothetical protein
MRDTRAISMLKVGVLVAASSLAIGLSQPVFARIGETEQEVQARYGQSISEQKPIPPEPAEKILHYRKDNIKVIVKFWRGVSAYESFEFDKPINGQAMIQVNAILNANATRSRFVPQPPTVGLSLHTWVTADECIHATIWRHVPNMLEIQTTAYIYEVARSRQSGGF